MITSKTRTVTPTTIAMIRMVLDDSPVLGNVEVAIVVTAKFVELEVMVIVVVADAVVRSDVLAEAIVVIVVLLMEVTENLSTEEVVALSAK